MATIDCIIEGFRKIGFRIDADTIGALRQRRDETTTISGTDRRANHRSGDPRARHAQPQESQQIRDTRHLQVHRQVRLELASEHRQGIIRAAFDTRLHQEEGEHPLAWPVGDWQDLARQAAQEAETLGPSIPTSTTRVRIPRKPVSLSFPEFWIPLFMSRLARGTIAQPCRFMARL